MRHFKTVFLSIAAASALSACNKEPENDVDRALKNVNVIDESNLNDIMLTVADPDEAVNYFQRASGENPQRLDLQRGLATSLIRGKRATEGAVIWSRVAAHKDATAADQVNYADALIRTSAFDKAETVLDRVPPTHETFKRYRLEAMVADSNKEWTKSDSFYETAVGLTTQPGNVLNNWGYSKLTRGDFPAAERLFGEAITYDPRLFTAKNNLVLARGAQKNYTLPVIQVNQIEKAQLLYTLGLSAIKQGDIEDGKMLLREAIEVHPQHFEDAVRSLRTLEKT